MKKNLMLALMLILCAALLCSCAKDSGTKFNVKTGDSQQQNVGHGAGDLDPLGEEDDYDTLESYPEVDIPTPELPPVTAAPTMRSEYAGATPVVIDPIDKPTPTPVPKLAVTYADYDATKIGLSFQAPAGWVKDDSANNTFILQNPDRNMDFAATLTLSKENVSTDYTTDQVQGVVKDLLNNIGEANFPKEYNPSQTSNRELLGKMGVYANYSGVMANGVKVSGRIHAVCVDKVVYIIHLSAPKAQWDDYKEMVYDHLRKNIKIKK